MIPSSGVWRAASRLQKGICPNLTGSGVVVVEGAHDLQGQMCFHESFLKRVRETRAEFFPLSRVLNDNRTLLHFSLLFSSGIQLKVGPYLHAWGGGFLLLISV